MSFRLITFIAQEELLVWVLKVCNNFLHIICFVSLLFKVKNFTHSYKLTAKRTKVKCAETLLWLWIYPVIWFKYVNYIFYSKLLQHPFRFSQNDPPLPPKKTQCTKWYPLLEVCIKATDEGMLSSLMKYSIAKIGFVFSYQQKKFILKLNFPTNYG